MIRPAEPVEGMPRHMYSCETRAKFNRRVFGQHVGKGVRDSAMRRREETYGESNVEAGKDVEDVKEEGVLLGEAVVDGSEPQDESANGPSHLSLSAVSPVVEGREGGGEGGDSRRDRNERHVDGRPDHVLPSIARSADEQQHAADEVEDKRRAQGEPELVQPRDERARGFGDRG